LVSDDTSTSNGHDEIYAPETNMVAVAVANPDGPAAQNE
jgi:hypothetical protein